MHGKMRDILPQEAQAALPAEIWRQPKHVGGSLGLRPGPTPVPPWRAGNGKTAPRRRRVPSAQRWINPYRGIVFPFVIGLASNLIMAANLNRCYLLIQNLDAANIMWVNFGNPAVADASVLLVARGNYELIGGIEGAAFSPMDGIHALGTVAGQRAIIVQGVPWADNS